MTEKEKAEVVRLRNSGRSYSEIAKATGFKEGTLKSVISRAVSSRFCDSCGKALSGRQGRFCSDACRYKWWKAHRDCGDRVCPVCGRSFKAADLRRTYCSRDCYHRSREKGDGEEE